MKENDAYVSADGLVSTADAMHFLGERQIDHAFKAIADAAGEARILTFSRAARSSSSSDAASAGAVAEMTAAAQAEIARLRNHVKDAEAHTGILEKRKAHLASDAAAA